MNNNIKKEVILENLEKNNSKYASDFDYLMHDFIIETIKPYFIKDNILELGAYKGEMTKKLLCNFKYVSSIEIIPELCVYLRNLKFENLQIFQTDFFEFNNYNDYDNIISCHSLEHVEKHKDLLKKIKKSKKDTCRLFIIVPNAFSLSRQIAVNMGLVSHPESITDFEKTIGHYHTFSINKLSIDIKNSGFKILDKGGIMPKIFSNSQYDRCIKNDIINTEFLRASYQLSKNYPELCSSIYFICE